ncbi:9153_t:CDS:2, partial [Dentiscutata erythropus]
HVESFTPSPRYSASSILVDSKLYFFGGLGKNSDGSEGCQNSVFYLDISSSFSTSDSIPWTDLTSIAALPVATCWQVSAVGSLNNSIYMFGGLMTNSSDQVNTLVYAFDTKIKQWSNPTISGAAPLIRTEFQIAQDSSRVYMFGGLSGPLTGSQNTRWFRDISILDIKSLSWLIVAASGVDLPLPQADFTATILNNGTIVYIGGRQATTSSGSGISYRQMDKTASGTIPGVRSGHSAVLAMDGRIIVYGGKENEESPSPANPDLAILDTASNVTQQTPTVAPGPSSNVYLLDISNNSNYTWITSFNAKNTLNPTSTNDQFTDSTPTYSILPSPTSPIISSNVAIIIGVAIGCSVSLIIVSVIAFLLIKRWLKYRKSSANQGLSDVLVSVDNDNKL